MRVIIWLALAGILLTGCKSAETKRQEQLDRLLNEASQRQSNGDSYGASQLCDGALKVDPNSERALMCRGKAKLALRDTQAAIGDFSSAIVISPKNAGAHVSRAQAYMVEKNYTQALSDLDAAIILEPRAETFAMRAEIKGIRGDTNEAVADYTRAIELDASYLPAYVGRAVAFTVLSQDERALSDLEYVLQNARDPEMRADAERSLQRIREKQAPR